MTIADSFRAATRPAVTIIFAAVIAQVVIEKIDAPQWFLAMASVVILEWWGERTIARIRDKGAGKQKERA
jgi:hypothetical protein